MLWEQLDGVYADLQRASQAQRDITGEPSYEHKPVESLKGECRGLAYAIAVMTTPYEPSVSKVNQQADERYRAALAGSA